MITKFEIFKPQFSINENWYDRRDILSKFGEFIEDVSIYKNGIAKKDGYSTLSVIDGVESYQDYVIVIYYFDKEKVKNKTIQKLFDFCAKNNYIIINKKDIVELLKLLSQSHSELYSPILVAISKKYVKVDQFNSEVEAKKYNEDDIRDRLNKKFDSEEEFQKWCCKVDGKSSYDDVSFDGITTFDLPTLLHLPVNDDEVHLIFTDILSEIDFDEYYQPRDGSLQDWEAKKLSKKYNIL